jgi:hypothetical protein
MNDKRPSGYEEAKAAERRMAQELHRTNRQRAWARLIGQLIVLVLVPLPFAWVWGHAVTPIFGLPPITYLQAFGLLLLAYWAAWFTKQ